MKNVYILFLTKLDVFSKYSTHGDELQQLHALRSYHTKLTYTTMITNVEQNFIERVS